MLECSLKAKNFEEVQSYTAVWGLSGGSMGKSKKVMGVGASSYEVIGGLLEHNRGNSGAQMSR